MLPFLKKFEVHRGWSEKSHTYHASSLAFDPKVGLMHLGKFLSPGKNILTRNSLESVTPRNDFHNFLGRSRNVLVITFGLLSSTHAQRN
jgi:hypothetical protein